MARRRKAENIGAMGITVGAVSLADDEVEGAVFDCDGTLIDSMSAWLPSWQYACGQYGLEMTESKFWGFAGVPLPDIVRSIYAEAHGGERASDAFVDEFLTCKKTYHKSQEAKKTVEEDCKAKLRSRFLGFFIVTETTFVRAQA